MVGTAGAVGEVGIICNAAHAVFGAVADRLRRRGHRVSFFEPGRELRPGEIDGLDLLANKKVDPASFRALRYADRTGVPTWNGSYTVLLGARSIGLRALEAVGCTVPPVSFEPPAGASVAKSLFDWHFEDDPEPNGSGDLYQPLLPTDGVDYKYYVVDDGDRVRVRVLRTTSKLHGRKRPIDLVDPVPELAASVRTLLARTGSNALGVDFVRSGGTYYAVDVNPAMSFRHTGMEAELTDSMAAAAGQRVAAVAAADDD